MKRSLATILNRTHPVGDRLLKPTEFRRQIDREMARTDRTGEQFCLLVLRNLVDAIPADDAKRIVETLSQRIRRTDDVGLIEHDQLAVLLPVTPLAGGNKLAKQLCDAIYNLIAEPEFEVFCYPSNWLMSSSPSTQSFPEDDSTSSGIAMRVSVSPKPIELLTVAQTPSWKRFLDILGAGFGLVCLSPLFLLIGTLIRITSPGPIFYAQERSGQGGKAFKIYKFRSMVIDADAKRAELLEQNEQDGPAFKIANDPRVTLIGKVLRAMSLDELPQLWNVV
ncbi:MAG: sugar transferase, partial [Planctomycetales bacterium]|nr:sugar transferase [Planctomycetales bacterium]